MDRFTLKPGDALLFTKESTAGVYTYFAEKNKPLADLLAKLVNHNYIHAELYLGNGWVIAGWFNGVKLYKPSLQLLSTVHIYRPPIEVDKDKLKESVKKYFNYEYDWVSLILNGLPEIISFGNEQIEKIVEDWVKYSDDQKLICSELIARIYEDLGYKIEPRAEFVTPDDIAERFQRVL